MGLVVQDALHLTTAEEVVRMSGVRIYVSGV